MRSFVCFAALASVFASPAFALDADLDPVIADKPELTAEEEAAIQEEKRAMDDSDALSDEDITPEEAAAITEKTAKFALDQVSSLFEGR